MVRQLGLAPSSTDYRSVALLLSYRRVAESGGLAPHPAKAGPSVFETVPAPRRVHSPENGGEQWSCPTGLAARNGFQPITALRGFTLQRNGGGERSCSPAAGPPRPLQTGADASVGFASESLRDRICTCVDPLRRRRPELLGHAEKTWTSRRDSHPQHGVRSAA